MSSFADLGRGIEVLGWSALFAALVATPIGCVSDDDDDDTNDVTDADDDDDDDDYDDGTFDGFEPYRPISLAPRFQLTPLAERDRFTTRGVALTNDDFAANATGFVSVSQKLEEIAAQIQLERGTGVPELVAPPDRSRADRMPFRGNPSDVDVLRVDGARTVFVPLGGSVGVPGNEVAVVTPGSGAAHRIKVGVRPVRTAAHPAGLVFVCNQYSPFLSIIDARAERILSRPDGSPVTLDTDYSCSDLALVPPVPGDELGDRVQLYVANQRLGAVERYEIDIVRGGINDRPVDVVLVEPPSGPLGQPSAIIGGVGDHPQRLRLSRDGTRVFVSSAIGGQIASIDVENDSVLAFTEVGGPALDVVELQDSVFVPTTSIDRGLLSRDDRAPDAVQVSPFVATGLDDTSAVVHPGSLLDGTRAYGLEDVRNGVVELTPDLSGAIEYYTDDVSPEPSFAAGQKVLAGALPIAAERDRAGNRLFLALSGSAVVQELAVSDAGARLQAVPDGTFATSARPFALAVDEEANQLLVAAWGGEVLEVFDLDDRSRVNQIDLGYANPGVADYPATSIERGELLFYSASWSNNGRKACASCHVAELSTDGLGFSIGTTAPTALRSIRPVANLITTEGYGGNGAIGGGGLGAIELRGQTRTSCELVAYGLVEGPSSDPATRIGDPVVTDYSGGDPAACRPEPVDPATGLPANFDAIAAEIAAEEEVVAQRIEERTGFSRDEVQRFVAWYLISQPRLPPNPLEFLREDGGLSADTQAELEAGNVLFRRTGCAGCHDPNYTRGPWSDSLEHGPGAGWTAALVNRYAEDPRLDLDGIVVDLSVGVDDQAVHQVVDDLIPFCFDADDCLVFGDPIAAAEDGDVEEETRRLELIDRFRPADPAEGFLPGNVVGQFRVNTPSLEGFWLRGAERAAADTRSVRERILAPGHPALRDGEDGFAITADGAIDVHGATSTLTPTEIDALLLYLESVE